MAFDEYCLEQLRSDAPLFYIWQNSPSVIIGQNQNAYGEVNLNYLETQGILLARRVTGGGAVYHDLQNLNYTIVGRSSDLEKDYPDYLNTMLKALKSLGVDASLTGRNDIMVEGKKVSGYAKRVFKDRLMVHGTLMYDVDLDTLQQVLSTPGSKLSSSGIASVRSKVANLKDYLPQFSSVRELWEALEVIMADGDAEMALADEDLKAIEKMRDEKFATWQWNYGRSNAAQFASKQKFSCGTVEVSYSLLHGCICDISFGGDYLGNLPSEAVAEALKGCRYERKDILETLEHCGVGDVFDSLTPDELTTLIINTK